MTLYSTQKISTIKQETGVGFGTSGARGLASAMTDQVCYNYVTAFLKLIKSTDEVTEVAIGGDLRPSTERIMRACAKAITDFGLSVINAGRVASPALAYFGMQRQLPTIMVTGSHIPDDRNGIKFTTRHGEITKAHENGILSQEVAFPESLFNVEGFFNESFPLSSEQNAPVELYKQRYSDFFGKDFLIGRNIGIYQHSAVARELLIDIYSSLGATTAALGRSETFIPVDTEAIREEDVALAKNWASSRQFASIISADGDSDRPLISDEHGNWLRGDVLGILAAKYLGATTVVAPVSCNTALEKCGWFAKVIRTKIGSPYVIAEMEKCLATTGGIVVGFEANGGFLLASNVSRSTGTLRALPTRDAVLPQLCVFGLLTKAEDNISSLLELLPKRFTESDRLKNFNSDRSLALFNALGSGQATSDIGSFKKIFGTACAAPISVDYTDGTRFTCADQSIVHLRPSGNAPELRCYAEAETSNKAQELVVEVLALAATRF